MDSTDESRERSLLLLRENHEFPGSFDFRMVVTPGHEASVVRTLADVIGCDVTDLTVSERPSRTGRFLALRIESTLQSAEQVLTCWDALGEVDGIITLM